MDDFVSKSGAKLWVHGHIHGTADYKLGNTRVICNSRGYYPEELVPDFNAGLVVEI